MIYELVAIVYLGVTLMFYVVNLGKQFRRHFEGKIVEDCIAADKEEGKFEAFAALLVYLILALFSFFFTVAFMFWTASKGIIVAKYYAFALIIYLSARMIFSRSVGRKKVTLKAPFRDRAYRLVTAVIEISITLFALWRLT